MSSCSFITPSCLDDTSRATSHGTTYLRFDFRMILREWCNETQKELDFIHEVGPPALNTASVSTGH